MRWGSEHDTRWIQMSFPFAFVRRLYPVVPRKRLHCLPISIWPYRVSDRPTDGQRNTSRCTTTMCESPRSLIPIRDRVSKIYCRSEEHRVKDWTVWTTATVDFAGRGGGAEEGAGAGGGGGGSTNWYCCKYTMCFAAAHRSSRRGSMRRTDGKDHRGDRERWSRVVKSSLSLSLPPSLPPSLRS